MRAARAPRAAPRLLVIERGRDRHEDHDFAALPRLLAPGDVLVVNDAATLPGSLRARVVETGEPLELRLMGPPEDDLWPVALLGRGDWRTPTERRPPPPRLVAGDALQLHGEGAPRAVIEGLSPRSSRLARLRLDGAPAWFWTWLYEHGRPIQYAHLDRPLALAEVQTRYASRPWAAEMPSAGRPLTAGLLLALRRRGVTLATLTHAAGLSAIGSPALDALLPLPERFDIPARTVARIHSARACGARVIAVGTTVVRALEGATRRGAGRLTAGAGVTELVIGPGFQPRCVDGLLTGVHVPGESHFELLTAFVPRARLEAALAHAEAAGYLNHEFGDTCLIGPSRATQRARRTSAA